MNPETLDTSQAIAAFVAGSLVLAILAGSMLSWGLWIFGKRPARSATRPQATVGLIDIMVTIVLLIGFISLAFILLQATRKLSQPKPIAQTPSASIAEHASTNGDATNTANPIEESTESKHVDEQGSSDNPKSSPAPKVTLTEEQFVFSAIAMSVQLICVIVVTFLIRLRTGAPFQFLGWRRDQVLGDLLAGLQCFLMVTPILLGLNAFFIYWTGVPYEHPIQQMLEKYPWMLGIAFWQASIVAPISEEFAFRSLLVGWFESIHFGMNKVESAVLGHPVHLVPQSDGESQLQPETYYTTELQRPEVASQPYPYTASEQSSSISYNPPWWPAILSGLLFGLAHFSFGVSWLSLVIFGVILGRLYQHRQSLIPVILVHFLFNTMGVFFMGLKLWLQNPS